MMKLKMFVIALMSMCALPSLHAAEKAKDTLTLTEPVEKVADFGGKDAGDKEGKEEAAPSSTKKIEFPCSICFEKKPGENMLKRFPVCKDRTAHLICTSCSKDILNHTIVPKKDCCDDFTVKAQIASARHVIDWRPAKTTAPEERAEMCSMQQAFFSALAHKTCGICREVFEEKNRFTPKYRKLLDCGHEFHTACIEPWLKKHHTCPMQCKKHQESPAMRSYEELENELNLANQKLEQVNQEFVVAKWDLEVELEAKKLLVSTHKDALKKIDIKERRELYRRIFGGIISGAGMWLFIQPFMHHIKYSKPIDNAALYFIAPLYAHIGNFIFMTSDKPVKGIIATEDKIVDVCTKHPKRALTATVLGLLSASCLYQKLKGKR
jgi:hypothetical protein